MTTLTGKIERIIFQTPNKTFSIFKLLEEPYQKNSPSHICKGNVKNISPDQFISVSGDFVIHNQYGKQLDIDSYEWIQNPIPELNLSPSNNKSSSIDECSDPFFTQKQYLSFFIDGIGPALAHKIVEAHKKDTFSIIENQPEKLSELSGISKKKAFDIQAQCVALSKNRDTMLFLISLQLSQNLISKIYEAYKDKAQQKIKENPFILITDIFGIGFKVADKIAQLLNFAPTNPHRIYMGIQFTLQESANLNGHCYLLLPDLIQKASALLNIEQSLIHNALHDLHKAKEIFIGKKNDEIHIFLYYYFIAEKTIAEVLLKSRKNNRPLVSSNIFQKNLEQIETHYEAQGLKLDTQQIEALLHTNQSKIFVITGGAGTGKTTTIKSIIEFLTMQNQKIALSAPTGRAAKRMHEATGHSAHTLHKLLKLNASDIETYFHKKEHNDFLRADFVIVDESSMIDVNLMYKLISALQHDTRLILVGDVDQLPSIGAGNVLRDIIESEKIPVVRLQTIYRQGAGSEIVTISHLVNHGDRPALPNGDFFHNKNVCFDPSKDFFFVPEQNPDNCLNHICDFLEYKKNSSPIHILSDIQILSPTRNQNWGIQYLNTALQKLLNPPDASKNELIISDSLTLRVGDKVMHTRNNYGLEWEYSDNFQSKKSEEFDAFLFDEEQKSSYETSDDEEEEEEKKGIFNGDTGIITAINPIFGTVTVHFDDNKIAQYSGAIISELTLSYAITVHKSQGSEYPIVILPIFPYSTLLMTRNLLYTAITRAKQSIVVIGDKETFYKMIENLRSHTRNTSLKNRLKNALDI